MTLKRLRDLIRFEAGIKGADTLTGFIDSLINQLLRNKTALHQYQELLLVNQPVIAAGVNNPVFTLPTTLQHFIGTSVRYSEGGELEDARYLFQSVVPTQTTDGFPTRFYRSANTITLWPQEIGVADAIWLDYYRYPTILVADADVFPIEGLVDTIKLEAIARVSRLSDTDKSQAFKVDAAQAYSESRGVD